MNKIITILACIFVGMNVHALELDNLPNSDYQYIDYTDTQIIDKINSVPGLNDTILEVKEYAEKNNMFYIIDFVSNNGLNGTFRIEFIFFKEKPTDVVLQSWYSTDGRNPRWNLKIFKKSGSLMTNLYLYNTSSSTVFGTGGTDFLKNKEIIKKFIDEKPSCGGAATPGFCQTDYNYQNFGEISSNKTNNLLDFSKPANRSYTFSFPIYSNIDITLELKEDIDTSGWNNGYNLPLFYRVAEDGKYYQLVTGDKFTPFFNKTGEITIKPKLQIKELKHDEFDGKYSSKTYEYSFDIYDKTKYRYYYSNDKVNFKEFTKNSLKVRYNMNMILYFKITDISGKEIVTYFHEINDITHKITDESLDHTGTGMPDYGDQSSDDPLDENSIVSDILGWFTDLFKKKLGIIFQIKEIYDSWLSYDTFYDYVCLVPDEMGSYGVTTGDIDERFQTPCSRIPELDLTPLGIDRKIDIINFDVFMDYQDEYFFWLKLSLSMITFYKVIKNVRHAFGGGK